MGSSPIILSALQQPLMDQISSFPEDHSEALWGIHDFKFAFGRGNFFQKNRQIPNSVKSGALPPAQA